MDNIAVVVPVYNAENKLKRCISSLLTQNTEAFDYQIIAVDDGSTDGTPSMLDEYAKSNDRFIVFHKNNGGPASARKFGIDHSQSEYLAFCDADDYVDEDWLLTMYKYLKLYNADISRIMAYININAIEKTYSEPCPIKVWNRDETIEKYIEHKDINGSLVVCLFKRNLFENIEWNFNMRAFEDDILTWQMLSKINSYVKVCVPKYHYMFCPTSLTNISYNLNRFESTNILIDRVLSDCEKMKSHQNSAKALSYQLKFINYSSFLNSGNMPKEIKGEMRNTLLHDFLHFFTKINGIKHKFYLICLIISPDLTAKLYQVFKR